MEENIAKHRYGEDESEAVVSQGCYDKEFEGTTDGDHKDLITAQENTQDDAYKNKENDFVVADEETVEASNKDDTPPCKEPQSIVVTTEHKGKLYGRGKWFWNSSVVWNVILLILK